jgi:hypothetical protein
MQGIALTDGVLKNNTLAHMPQNTSSIRSVQPLHPLHTAISDRQPGNNVVETSLFFEYSPNTVPPSLFNSELSSVQIQGYIHPSIAENLRRVSFFDLMKTPPSIHQLCNPDFKDLVAKMVALQKESSFFAQTRRKAPIEVMEIQTNSGIPAVSEIASAKINSLSQEGILNHLTHEQNQNVPYNHLLHAPQNGKSTPDAQSPHFRKSPRTPLKQEKKAYFDKIKSTKKTNYSQKLIKSLVFTLNTLSARLSKHLE